MLAIKNSNFTIYQISGPHSYFSRRAVSLHQAMLLILYLFEKREYKAADLKSLKYKDDLFVLSKNYKVLYKKQSGCQQKILHKDKRETYMGDLDNYLKKNRIIQKVTVSYIFKQN